MDARAGARLGALRPGHDRHACARPLGDDGRIVGWDYAVWSNTHSTRPGPPARCSPPGTSPRRFPEPEPKLQISPAGNGDRNAVPLYAIPHKRVVWHFIRTCRCASRRCARSAPISTCSRSRASWTSWRTAAGADPVEFRLRHLDDPRARDVVNLAAERFGWKPGSSRRPAAAAASPSRATRISAGLSARSRSRSRSSARAGARASCARSRPVDSGEVVNPDGIRNQIEGGILQAVSWTLYESVSFDETRVTSLDWASYPILRFDAVPDTIEVHVIDRARASPSSAPARRRRGRRRPPSPTPSPTRPGSACAICPSRARRVKAAIGV